MALHPFIYLPLFGGIVSLLSGLVALWWLKNVVKDGAKPLPSHPLINVDVRGVWQENGLDQELEVLLDRRLNGMVEAMKEQIPMAGMLLSQAREDKLKGQAQIELVKAVPEIKAMLLDHLEVRVKCSSVSSPKVQSLPLEAVKPSCKEPCQSALCFLCITTALGIFFGFLAAFAL